MKKSMSTSVRGRDSGEMLTRKHDFVSELSEILGVPASTLRYWEREDLIHFQRNKQNNYRIWTLPLMFEIGDIMFYRDLAVPVKELKHLATMTREEMESTLDGCEERLLADLEKTQHSLKRLRQRKEALQTVKRLQTPQVMRTRIPAIYDLVFEEPAGMRHRLSNPYAEVAFAPASTPEKFWGTTLSDFQGMPILRPGDSEDKIYLNCLLTLEYHNETNASTMKHNVRQLTAYAASLGYATGDVIGKYLLSAYDKFRCTYYDCYIELKRDADDPTARS